MIAQFGLIMNALIQSTKRGLWQQMTRRLSPAEAQAVITEASARVIEQGFDAAMFTNETVIGAFLPIKSYLRLAKQFTRHEDRQIRDGLLDHAISNNIIQKPGSATFADVVKFLKYLISPVGQQVQYLEQQKAQLRRKPSGLSPDQAQAQITEASARIIEHGFDAALFNTDAVYGAGLPISQFLKLAKKFTMFDRGFRDELLTEAIRSNIIEAPSSATFADVRSKYSVQKAKLCRKVGDDGVVQEAAIKIFKPQMDDFATPQKRESILELAGGVEVPPVVDSLTFPPNKRVRGNSS
ncbi:hypothetical protein CXB51_012838 [Gossypium anomalum]|uniref:Uncharacterized protein n=1 Tax=Gossypium anomalum TaxID=47600 RepID=A0A8J5YRM9_9ROSI|nr:hypothetical protein CXB51_012838 [Gossypium anomalum]